MRAAFTTTSRELVRACLLAGLTSVKLEQRPQKRLVGRPRGAEDGYPRERRTWRVKFEEEAALMRERFGAVEDYERELHG